MRMSLAVVSACLFFVCSTPFAPAATVEVVAPGSTVAGKRIGEWTADWWNWANSVSPNVFEDATGALANQNQSGPVFFVAGTSADDPPATRNFTVPEGKYVLFPLLNWVIAAGPDPGFTSTAEEAEALVDGTIDPANLVAEIDGVAVSNLENYRERSQINFTFVVEPDTTGFPPGTYTDANADGYWIMLAPLTAGDTHTLHFGGTSTPYTGPTPPEGEPISIDSFTVDVTANITVSGATPIPLPPGVFSCIPFGAAALASVQWRRWRRGR